MTTAFAPTFRPVRCGNRREHGDARVFHNGPAEVRNCFDYTHHLDELAGDEFDADAAYERHLEDRGYDEARAQEAYEAAHGVVGFVEAWHNESPTTCPCCN